MAEHAVDADSRAEHRGIARDILRRALGVSALLIVGQGIFAEAIGGYALAREVEKAAVAATVEPCPAKGPGFVRLPGSRTCTRLSGRVAAGADLRARQGAIAVAPGAAGRFAIDNRTDSDLGEIRTYVRIGSGRR